MSFDCCLYLIPCVSDEICTNSFAPYPFGGLVQVNRITCASWNSCDDIQTGQVIKLEDGCCYFIEALFQENCEVQANFVECYENCESCEPQPTPTPTPTRTVTPTRTPTPN
jgi:hypothetical protein